MARAPQIPGAARAAGSASSPAVEQGDGTQPNDDGNDGEKGVERAGVEGSGIDTDHAALRSRIAELEAQIAEAGTASKLPQPVYEPRTPHGAAALAASDYAGMTVAQLMAKIDAGEAREPFNSVLCADGWYARRA